MRKFAPASIPRSGKPEKYVVMLFKPTHVSHIRNNNNPAANNVPCVCLFRIQKAWNTFIKSCVYDHAAAMESISHEPVMIRMIMASKNRNMRGEVLLLLDSFIMYAAYKVCTIQKDSTPII